MSADEFDPDIERLFARTPPTPDAAIFTAEVENRLQKGWRLRFAVLSLAGLVGGVVAVREVVTVRFTQSADDSPAALGQGMEAVAFNAQAALQNGLDQLGVGGMDMGAVSGMQLFWVAAGALIAVAAAGMMRLSQEV